MKEAPLKRVTPSFLASLSLSIYGCPLHIIVHQLSNNSELKMNSRADVEAPECMALYVYASALIQS